jgi:RimJ/RimL family protein N-acetyltransferase
MFTERLRLIPVTPSMRNAMRDSRAAFAALVGVSLSERWPQFPEAFSLGTRSTPDPWTGYLFILRSAPILVGNGGFVSEPDEAGKVEIGYEIAPTYWSKGYATEAAGALIQSAFESGAASVIAHSLAETNASNAVMRKIGMKFAGERPTDGGMVWCWRINRRDHAKEDTAGSSR